MRLIQKLFSLVAGVSLAAGAAAAAPAVVEQKTRTEPFVIAANPLAAQAGVQVL